MNFSISLFYGNGNHWPIWFISALFTTQLFFYFFHKWRISYLLLGVLCVVVFLITDLCNWKDLPWEMDLVPVVGIFILGGYFLYSRLLSKIDKKWYVWLIIISIALGSFAALLNGRVDMNSRCYGNVMLYFTSSFFLSFAFIIFFVHFKNFHLLKYIGKNTLIVLGIHLEIGIVLNRILDFVSFNMGTNGVICTLVSLISSILLLIICMPFISVINKRFTFLTGKI